MRHVLVVAAMLIGSGLAMAQQEDNVAGKVTELSRHIAEVKELLATPDPAVRDAAIETALRDPSQAIRGLAIYYALRRYDHLPLGFALPAGSPIPRENLPSLTLAQVQWSEDGRSLSARGGPCGGLAVSGQVTGDRLRLQFGQICVSGELSGTIPNRPGTAPRTVFYRGCETELSPTQARDALVGPLRCPGLPVVLPLSLPLG
jgi:hypothetical protein